MIVIHYIVQKGDTLYGIARQYGVSIDQLKSVNGLFQDTLSVGMKLLIPTGEGPFYRVQKGDTLYGISQKFHVPVSSIMDANELSSSVLQIGQILRIPDVVDEDFTYYHVVLGDSLYSIAKKYQTTVSNLIQLNQLQSTNLTIGQILKVPNVSPSTTYVVEKGDTLYSIASKFGLSVQDLKNYNGLITDQLSVGQSLSLVPTSSTIPIGSSCYGETYQETEYLLYTVKKGDNLYSIAKKYGVSVSSLLSLNQLSNTNLSIGQILKIKEVS